MEDIDKASFIEVNVTDLPYIIESLSELGFVKDGFLRMAVPGYPQHKYLASGLHPQQWLPCSIRFDKSDH